MNGDGFDWRGDGSDYTYGQRLEHYQKQWGMFDAPMDQRLGIDALAHRLTTEEMLTEIHAMLRTLVCQHDKK
jgi:hypothetical protein